MSTSDLTSSSLGQPSSDVNDLSLPDSTIVYLVLTIILPIFAIAPLFYPGYIQTHTGFVPLWHVADLRAHLGDLGWTPSVATAFDPLRSDGLLAYYLAAVLPVTPTMAVKTVLGGSWLAGSVGMFLWLRSWIGNPGGLISALVYTYLPYHIATVYVRGAWGEALFLGLLPWAILAATFLVTAPRWPLLPIAAGFWLLLGLSHLGLTLWALLFITTMLLVIHRPQALLPLLAALLGTVVAAGLYWPFFSPTHSNVNFADHFLYPFQLFSAFWGSGFSTPSWDDGLSFQLGLAALGLSTLTVILWQRAGYTPELAVARLDRRLLFFSAAIVFLTLLQLGLAAFLWRLPLWPGLTLAETLTYPWQLLGLTGLGLSVLAGAALWLDRQLSQIPLFAALLILVVLSSYQYLGPQFVQPEPYASGPEATLGTGRLTLLDHEFTVVTSDNTAGLERGKSEIPVAVHGPLKPGDRLRLTVVWQPLQPFASELKIFVHLVDPNDTILVQFDGQPQGGDNPTSQWVPGQIIADSYDLTLPPDSSPGPYRVFVGLYDEATMTRLPVVGDKEGRVTIDVR